jgi:hypothetical protein
MSNECPQCASRADIELDHAGCGAAAAVRSRRPQRRADEPQTVARRAVNGVPAQGNCASEHEITHRRGLRAAARKPRCHMCITPAATWMMQSKFLPRPMRFLSTDPGVHHHEAAGHARRLFLFAETEATLQCPRRPDSYAAFIIGCVIQARIPMPPMRIFPETQDDDKQRN